MGAGIKVSSIERGPKVSMKTRRLTRKFNRLIRRKLDFPRTFLLASKFQLGLEGQPTHFHGHFGVVFYTTKV